MPKTTVSTFVLHSVGRDIEEHWEETLPLDSAVWSDAIPVISNRTYEHKGCVASVHVNFQPMVRRLKRDFAQRRILYGRPSARQRDRAVDLLWKLIKIPYSVTLTGTNDLTQYDWYPRFFAECLVYDTFVILNLSLPGCCNLSVDEPL